MQEMCSTPLKYEAPQGQADVPFCGYGSFHAELRLDGATQSRVMQRLPAAPHTLTLAAPTQAAWWPFRRSTFFPPACAHRHLYMVRLPCVVSKRLG